jgi:hypothetical protein
VETRRKAAAKGILKRLHSHCYIHLLPVSTKYEGLDYTLLTALLVASLTQAAPRNVGITIRDDTNHTTV